MSTVKLKNIKQTVVGTTIQPLKLGGILEDGSDAKISIDTSGNLTASNLTATLNGLLTTNGQIKFPATQNPSSDANTLDDYEEGTFTIVLTGTTTSPTVTYTINNGYYVKIGNFVAYNGSVSINTISGGNGAIIFNLPFPRNTSTPFTGSVLTVGVDFGASKTAVYPSPFGSSGFSLAGIQNNAVASDVLVSFISAGDVIMFNITYFTA